MASFWKPSEALALALHTMVFIAENPDHLVTTHEVAEKFKVSEHHLAKIHQRLTRAGLIRATRGPRGGFRLNKDASQIRLLDIYEVIEGPGFYNDCVFGEPTCGRSDCIFGEIIIKSNEDIKQYFQSTKLSDLIDMPKASKRKTG